MKFKAGDEVFIKAEITDVSGYECSERPYFVAPDIYSVNWVSEDKIILMDKTYEVGLADAWELARKVYDMKCDAIEEIFGVKGGFYEVIRNFTFEDCRDKIESHENEKKIKVGDVVKYGNTVGVVTCVTFDLVSVMWKDGSTGDNWKPKDLTKTGKHIDIESLLKEIGE